MAATDTPPHVRRRVEAVFAAMSGAERLRLACEMADEAREVTLAGIRARNPGSDEAAVHAEWLRLLHGEAVAAELARCSTSS